MWRAIAAGVSGAVAAVVGVVTGLVTQHSSVGLWVALGVLIVLGAVLQAAVTGRDSQQSPTVQASGPGSTAIGGSVGELHTGAINIGGDPSKAWTDAAEADGQSKP